ncbi:MAG: 1-deoxy-D-xylulose 5-phosphate reductoisomerase [Fimbriimonadaceae bacterium]|nr:1-deoxy-D-xylulose 5-phosphate reductoisomerase [Fimbriimonadaceae bacterium]
MKRVAILGSTGSIGVQTLDVISRLPDRLKVVALAAHSSGERVLAQAREFSVSKVALWDESAANHFKVQGGEAAVVDLVTSDEVDIVVVSVSGAIGLIPTLAAIGAGKMIALASKEVLVSAGEIVMPLVRSRDVVMTPIDSEHSAIFQCVRGYGSEAIAGIILSASGGPFRGRSRAELSRVTVEEALNHPTWRMGGKITVDSATLMNKGLEMIEARWLFGLEPAQIEVVIHPQSIIHSYVRLRDGSVLAQLGWPDMRLPIQVALLHPDRIESGLPRWNPADTPELTFHPTDDEAFPALGLARSAMETGGTMACAMNAANEEAANAFLRGECGFLDIAECVEKVMTRHDSISPTLEAIIEVDAWARATARELLSSNRN